MKRFLLAAALVCVALPVFPDAAASRPRPPQPRIAERAVASRPEAVRKYWTRKRLRAARPLTLTAPVNGTATRTSALAATDDGSDLPPGRFEPSAPAPTSPALRTTMSAEVTDDYTGYPLSTHGRLFGYDPIGSYAYVCSATAVNGSNESLVWTAGHCVHNDGHWMTNLLFVPAYKDGGAPLGEWSAIEMLAPRGWTEAEYDDYTYDMAALVVAPLDGRRLIDAVGGRGFAYNRNPWKAFEAYGYPAEDPFSGERLIRCSSQTKRLDESMGRPPTIGIGCNMTGGSSGGGWIIDGNYVNSNVSYGYSNDPNSLYGPYFGDAALALYEAASQSTAPDQPPDELGATVATPTPEPTPTTEPVPTRAARRITLRVTRRAVARGRVIAERRCSVRVRVKVSRRRNGKWRVVGRDTTNREGRYRLRLPTRRGRFRARVHRTPYCASATSPIRRA